MMRNGSVLGLALLAALSGCGEPEAGPADTIALVASASGQSFPVSAPTPIGDSPASDQRRKGHSELPLDAARPLPAILRGVTTDSAWDVPALTAAVRAHTSAPIVRIVLDPQPQPAAYRPAIDALRPHAYLMGLLLDSTALRRFTAAEVSARADAYLAMDGDRIDLWEIGNELNGAWVGRTPEEINAKVQAAHDVVAGKYHKRTAITLNYWSGPNCYAKSWEDTLTFAAAMPAVVRSGTDIVMLSIYETACRPAQHPSAAEIGETLASLGQLFPNAKLAIGETGAQGQEDGLPKDPTPAKKRAMAERYYGMDAALRARLGARFVGGYFWWYYFEDAVPRNRSGSLWPTLDRLMAALG